MSDTAVAPKYKTGPTIKAQTERAPPPPPPVQVTLPEHNDPWHAMETLPTDIHERIKLGYLYLRGDPYAGPDEMEREFYWYMTRQFRKGIWQRVGWWRRRFGPATPPGFTPTGWRQVSEGYPTDGTL